VYDHSLHQHIERLVAEAQLDTTGADSVFHTRLVASASVIRDLFQLIYGQHPLAEAQFSKLIHTMIRAHQQRPVALRDRDDAKMESGYWFLSSRITGMSLYVDRFAGSLGGLRDKLGYLEELGVNLLHLMPIFESPEGESDGGYAVSDFRTVDTRFGTIRDLRTLQTDMQGRDMYLMLDIVLNHTSHHHDWAARARAGDAAYQDYYYMFPDRTLPDAYDRHMPEIFPESSPGNFTYVPECRQWVMTVFHQYQWDLNYTNPRVFVDMLDNIFFYANLGVDILRIDAPAFIWKQLGTTCQNLPEAHTILRLIKQCVVVSTPGMALLGEAIVAPREIMKYFGTGNFTARECDFAYNATHMALQWDALATGDTRVMMAAQHEIMQKPYGTSWITYTRCHDDIGLGYDDYMIRQAGFDPFAHRSFIKDYYSGQFPGSMSSGALFSVNPRTNDARISGSLASLCGLEKALLVGRKALEEEALRKIILMQAHSFFLGGIPMLFYGDEIASINDYSYLEDPGKNYDNRWMHRPVIDWTRATLRKTAGSPEQKVFEATQRLIRIRKSLSLLDDIKNLQWIPMSSRHLAGYIRTMDQQRLFCIFNFSGQSQWMDWNVLSGFGPLPTLLWEHWSAQEYADIKAGSSVEIPPYGFFIWQAR
jgi:amylosucrase